METFQKVRKDGTLSRLFQCYRTPLLRMSGRSVGGIDGIKALLWDAVLRRHIQYFQYFI